MQDWDQCDQTWGVFSTRMQHDVIISSNCNHKHSIRVPYTHTHTHWVTPPSPTSSLGHFRSGSMLEEHGSNGLWETVESPMRALQTACCRASPPTYDCSPAVAVATAALDGRLLYFLSVCARARKHVFISILKAKLLTADLDPLKQEVYSVTPNSKELKTVLKASFILFSFIFKYSGTNIFTWRSEL